MVEPGSSYLKTVCDYVHLNSVRARMLSGDDPLRAYPWSSLTWHLSAPKHRPAWIRSDRLLGAHGLQKDRSESRAQFERRREARRQSEEDEEEWKPLRRGWCLGSEQFKNQMLAKIERELGEHHSGALRKESAEMKAERIIAEELRRLGWSNSDLLLRLKGDPAKMAMALRLRKETTLTLKEIAQRFSLGSVKSARMRFHKFSKTSSTSGKERTLL